MICKRPRDISDQIKALTLSLSKGEEHKNPLMLQPLAEVYPERADCVMKGQALASTSSA
jgi:hypothetical protein